MIGEELAVHQGRLDRNRLIASQLGRSVVMSPVTADVLVETDEGNRSDSTMPVSLAASADHVEQQLKVLRQSLDLLAENTERQTSAVSNCNGAITTAERLINTARQTLCTVEEEEGSEVEGERIEDKLIVLRDTLFQLSPTEQQLNSAPISQQLPVSVQARPQTALCETTSDSIQTTLQVHN